jgi:hypothetical protein
VTVCSQGAKQVRSSIPEEWNSLERYVAGRTKNLHYTNMSGQPWRKWGHPLGKLWIAALREAIAAGLVTKETVQEEVKRHYVVPQVREAVA